MERIEYRDIIDKSDWARGVWDKEPDKIQWQDDATGLPCLIVRGPVEFVEWRRRGRPKKIEYLREIGL